MNHLVIFVNTSINIINNNIIFSKNKFQEASKTQKRMIWKNIKCCEIIHDKSIF